MELLRYFWDAAGSLDPAAETLDEGRGATICNPGALTDLFAPRLEAVEVTGIVIPIVFHSFDDYWTPFLGGVGPAPNYVVSLDEEHRNALRDTIHSSLPITSDGSLTLRMRAWAVKGVNRV